MKAHLTLWPGGLYDTRGEPLETTWAEWFTRLSSATEYLGDRKHPGWSAAILEPCERADENVVGLSALILDYDAGTPIDDAIAPWTGHVGFLHTTRKHAPTAPRFRLILPLSRIVTPDEYAVIWRWAKLLAESAGHKVDGSTKNSSRFWYLPGTKPGGAFELRHLPGEATDPDPILASDAEAGAINYVDRYAENARRTGAILPTNPEKRARAYLSKIPPAISGSGGHHQCWAAAMAVVVGFDLGPDAAYRVLAEEYNHKCSPPWSEKELRHKVESADKLCKRQRGYLLAARTNNVRPLRPISRPSSGPPLQGTGTDGPVPEAVAAQFCRGDEAELAAAALRTLHSDDAPLCFDDGDFYRYAPERGVWDLIEAASIRNTVAAFAGSWVNEGGRFKILKMSQSTCSGATNRLRDVLSARASRPQFHRYVPGVAFQNGFVRLVDGSPTLVPHAPQHMARAGLPFPYDPDAPRSKLSAFLETLFSDASEADRADRISLLQEFVGASLFGLAPAYQHCLMLYGTGGNGKSQVLTIVESCFPAGTVCALSPKDWDGPMSRFRLEQLQGKQINIVDEMPSRDEFTKEIFKAIVTGGEVMAERKGKDAFSFRPRAGHIFSGNALPSTQDQSAGFFRRFHVLPFSRNFDKDASRERQIDAGRMVVDAERAGIVAWAVLGAARLVAKGSYTVPESVSTLKKEWEIEADSVRMFVAEACEQRSDSFSSDLYKNYSRWGKDNGFKPVSLTSFGRRLKAIGIAYSKDGHDRTVYRLCTKECR